MFWTIAVAAAIGALLGTSYRAPALIAATGGLVAAIVAQGAATGAGAGHLLARAIAGAAALQAGYLAGVGGALVWRWLRSR